MCGPTATWCCGFCLISIFWCVCWNMTAVRTSLVSVFDNLHYSRWRETGSSCFISGHFISPSYVILTDLGPDFWKEKRKKLKVYPQSIEDTQSVSLSLQRKRLRRADRCFNQAQRHRILTPVRIIKMIFLLPIRFADTSGNNLGSVEQAFSSLSMCFALANRPYSEDSFPGLLCFCLNGCY